MGGESSKKLKDIEARITESEINVQPCSTLDAAQGALLGAFIGDAAGATLEFKSKVTYKDALLAMSLQGGGKLHVGPGQITDDSELALCLAHALIDGKNILDINIIVNYYIYWILSNPFDLGNTIRGALKVKGNNADPDDIRRNARERNMKSISNGSLMRLTPLCIWGHKLKEEELIQGVKEEVILTHPNIVCQEAAVCYALAIGYLIRNPGEREKAFGCVKKYVDKCGCLEIRNWLDDAISGNLPDCSKLIGWAKIAFVHAFNFLLNSEMNYTKAIFEMLKKGGDTDTNAAIVGGLIGAAVGVSNINEHQKQQVLTWSEVKGGIHRADFFKPGNPSSPLLEMGRDLHSMAPRSLFVVGGRVHNVGDVGDVGDVGKVGEVSRGSEGEKGARGTRGPEGPPLESAPVIIRTPLCEKREN